MNAETLAEWLRRRGHRIIRGAGSLWYDAGARVFQPIPFHQVFSPPEADLRALMREAGAAGLRYSTPPEATTGLLSYHVVFDEGAYSLENIRPRTRNKTRRGLRESRIGQISFDELASKGWRLQRDTLERQGRLRSMNEAEWTRLCRAAHDLPGFEAWGARVDDELAASMLIARIGDTVSILTAQSHRAYFDRYVNNALCYTVSSDVLSRPGVRAVFYSIHSLDAPPSVDEFKFLMGYRAKPVRQRILFHPLIAPLMNPFTHRLIRRALRVRPDNVTLSKAEGLLRFYLEGQRPAHQQDLPPVLQRGLSHEQAVV